MIKKFFIFALLLILQQASWCANGQNVTNTTDTRFIITVNVTIDFPGADIIENLIDVFFNGRNITFEKIMNIPAIDGIVMKIPEIAAKLLIELPFIKDVEIDYMYTLDVGTPRLASSFSSEQTPYGLDMVGATSVSNANVGNIKVCIIDSGYDTSHPDLPSVSGTTLVSDYPWDEDGYGHGTHVAGTIAAIGGNDQGVVGVFGNTGESNIHIIRVFDSYGNGYTSVLIQAVQACIDEGSKIVTMSLGHDYSTRTERDYFEAQYNAGILFVAAAGNDKSSYYKYPASYDSVISVASIDEYKYVSDFSNFNDQVDLSAPGTEILSTTPGGNYEYYNGTSMAAPHVAGVAALVWSMFPDKSNSEIRTALEVSAEDLGVTGYDIDFGYGLVRADLAVSWLENGGSDGDDNDTIYIPPSASPAYFPPSPTPAYFPPSPSPEYFPPYPSPSNGVAVPSDDDSTSSCQNYPSNWVDSTGDTCDDFYTTSTRCSRYGDNFEDPIYEKTANDVCCTCGGGKSSDSNKDENEECTDDTDWEDSMGDNCDWYNTISRCSLYGNSFENDGKTASEACCYCQGITVSSLLSVSKENPRSGTPTNNTNPSNGTTVSKSTSNAIIMFGNNKFTVLIGSLVILFTSMII